jgi:hypothetical protein
MSSLPGQFGLLGPAGGNDAGLHGRRKVDIIPRFGLVMCIHTDMRIGPYMDLHPHVNVYALSCFLRCKRYPS